MINGTSLICFPDVWLFFFSWPLLMQKRKKINHFLTPLPSWFLSWCLQVKCSHTLAWLSLPYLSLPILLYHSMSTLELWTLSLQAKVWTLFLTDVCPVFWPISCLSCFLRLMVLKCLWTRHYTCPHITGNLCSCSSYQWVCWHIVNKVILA